MDYFHAAKLRWIKKNPSLIKKSPSTEELRSIIAFHFTIFPSMNMLLLFFFSNFYYFSSLFWSDWFCYLFIINIFYIYISFYDCFYKSDYKYLENMKSITFFSIVVTSISIVIFMIINIFLVVECGICDGVLKFSFISESHIEFALSIFNSIYYFIFIQVSFAIFTVSMIRLNLAHLSDHVEKLKAGEKARNEKKIIEIILKTYKEKKEQKEEEDFLRKINIPDLMSKKAFKYPSLIEKKIDQLIS